MMALKSFHAASLKSAALRAGLKIRFERGRLITEPVVPRPPIVEGCRADDSDFCLWVTDGSHRAGGHPILTEEQMKRAAERYRLGKSRSGKTIFWMIDEMDRVHDGHIGDSWVSVMLKAREPKLLRDWHAEHCLFGLHLLNFNLNPNLNANFNPNLNPNCQLSMVCVVEKETSAVILSELFPEYIWMATCTPMNLMLDRLEPLRSCQVTLFPSTDMTMGTFLWWQEVAEEARQKRHLNITVSSVLEDCATEEQKRRKIDLVDFLVEELKDPNVNTNPNLKGK